MTRKEGMGGARDASLLVGRKAQDRINRQKGLVATLAPGTDHHRLATKVLTLLQDSALLVAQTRAMIFMARMSVGREQRG